MHKLEQLPKMCPIAIEKNVRISDDYTQYRRIFVQISKAFQIVKPIFQDRYKLQDITPNWIFAANPQPNQRCIVQDPEKRILETKSSSAFSPQKWLNQSRSNEHPL